MKYIIFFCFQEENQIALHGAPAPTTAPETEHVPDPRPELSSFDAMYDNYVCELGSFLHQIDQDDDINVDEAIKIQTRDNEIDAA